MDEKNRSTDGSEKDKVRSKWLRLFGIAALCLFIIAVLVAGWVKYNLYASPFKPAALSGKEQNILDSKISALTQSRQIRGPIPDDRYHMPAGQLKPEPYTEEGASREISLSEKELNSLITDKGDVARRVAIDLSDNLVSVKLAIPVDEEVIFLGGKTLRLTMGILLSYENDKPVVAIKGISLGGIPLPNAWLGYLKERNLVEEFGTETGFWKLFAEGVKDMKVKEGRIQIRLKE